MTCTTLATPTSSTTSTKRLNNRFASFTLSDASYDLKNKVPYGQETRKFMMVQFFASAHPSDMIVHLVMAHDSLNSLKYTSKDVISFCKRDPLKSCILGPLKPLPAATTESHIGWKYGERAALKGISASYHHLAMYS